MQTSSADGKKDLLLGLVVLVTFSFLGYLFLTNINFLVNNLTTIFLLIMGGTLGFVILYYIADLVKTGINNLRDNESHEADKIPKSDFPQELPLES